MRHTWTCALALAVSLGCTASASAVEWTVGAGIGVAPDYEGSSDYQPVPLWNIRAKDLYDPNTYVQIRGLKLRSNLLPHDNFRLGLGAEYIFPRDDVSSRKVNNLGKTNSGTMLGIILGYDFKFEDKRTFGIELDGRYDVRDNIGGLVTGRLKYGAPLASNLRFTAGVETTWASEDYMDNAFEVTANGSTASGFSTFDPDAGFKDVGLNSSLTYIFTKTWSVTGIASYTRLIGDADDSSPVTDEGSENQFFGGLTVNYRF